MLPRAGMACLRKRVSSSLPLTTRLLALFAPHLEEALQSEQAET